MRVKKGCPSWRGVTLNEGAGTANEGARSTRNRHKGFRAIGKCTSGHNLTKVGEVEGHGALEEHVGGVEAEAAVGADLLSPHRIAVDRILKD